MVADTIILSICGKYKDFCSNQSRTLIIDPIPEQKAAYEFLVKVFDLIVNSLKVGETFSDVCKKVKDQASKTDNGHLVKFLPKVLGYGIGLKPKEELLAIKEDNDKIIEVGMVFNIRVSLANFDSKKRPNRNCLQVADTVLVVSDGPPEVLTRSTSKAYNDISYTLNDDEEDLDEGAEAERTNKNPKHNNHMSRSQDRGRSKNIQKKRVPEYSPEREQREYVEKEPVILEQRLRTEKVVQKNDDERKLNQERLFKKRYDEFKKNWEEDKVRLGDNLNQKQIRVANANSYSSSKEFPSKTMKNGMAYFDNAKQTLLVPMKMEVDGEFVFIPFHIYTIKNVAMNIEKSVAFLRVNFHTALQYGKDIVVPNLDAKFDTVFIKEITLKSETGGHNL